MDANGNIGVTYYDFRNNDPATPALETDTWFTRSTDGGATWSEERVTPTSFDMRTAPVARGFFTGDCEGLTALGGDFWSLVSESRGAAGPALKPARPMDQDLIDRAAGRVLAQRLRGVAAHLALADCASRSAWPPSPAA